MNIHFTALRAFYEVGRCGSFTEAAERLCLTQPAISKGVSGLEASLGIALLERTSRQVSLTEAGQGLWLHARSIFALERAALDEMAQWRGVRRGRLHIGASTTIASYWLAHDLAQFLRSYPDMDIEVSSGNTRSIVQRVSEGEVEMALVEGPVQENHLDCQWWRNEPMRLVRAPFISVTGNALAEQRWVLREQGSGTARVVEHYLERAGISPRQQVIVESNQAVVELVVAGCGVAIVPEVMALPHLRQGELVELPWPLYPLQRPLSKITLKGRPASPARAAFEKILVSVAEADQDSALRP